MSIYLNVALSGSEVAGSQSGLLDLNAALGFEDNNNGSDESFKIGYSKSSEEESDSNINGHDVNSKEEVKVSNPQRRQEVGVIEQIDVHSSQSKDDANPGEDGETSRKSDDGNDLHEVDETSMKHLANLIEKKLEVGCSVVGIDECYLLYCEYERLTGFSVRRGDQRYFGRFSTEVRWKEFVCSCSGETDNKRSRNRVGHYRKMVVRTKCEAKLKIIREDLAWRVDEFVKNHNHDLVEIDQSYLLRSSRTLAFAKVSLLEALHSSGIPLNKACDFMEKMSGGVQNTGYTRKYAYNHFDKKKRVTRIEDGDAMALIDYCNEKSNSDPFFFWKLEKDDEGRLMHLFLRDSRCASDYKAFGDVLSLDTTGGTNKYKLPCAPFVGVNHHRTNVMFGLGFISDERTRSFNWLLDVFLESMDGVAPNVVITDQCKALMNAVDSRFPNATHRLCTWHINQNAMSHFGKLAGNEAFKGLWARCIDGVQTEDEFQELWNDMMTSYEIRNREWFNTTYGLRRRWACVFSKNIFTAGVKATSRSEGTNMVLKDEVKCTMSLSEFLYKHEDVQRRWHLKEREEDTRCIRLPGQFVNGSKFLRQTATIYTRKNYELFEKECTLIFNVHIDFDKAVPLSDGNIQFNATLKCEKKLDIDCEVVFNPSTNCATCSCRKWESEGLLCCHIIKVYLFKTIEAIPEQYILKRWTKKARLVATTPVGSRPTISKAESSMQYSYDITRMVHEVAYAAFDEGREEISKTILALRDKLLNSKGHEENVSPSKLKKATPSKLKKATPSKNKEKEMNEKETVDILFHDPKKPKKRKVK